MSGPGALLAPDGRPSAASGSKVTGVSVVEVLAIIALGAAVCAAAVPAASNLQSSVSVRSAAGEVGVLFHRARAYAITRGVIVGLKFRRNGDRYEWAMYRDGNGNGIRTVEIAKGIDRPMGLVYPWMRSDVRPGILKGSAVPDPGNPRKTLDRVDDPIRFNNSDICSFSPIGESTPGSVYLWDGKDRMAVVRVYGRSAKMKTLFYRRGQSSWTP